MIIPEEVFKRRKGHNNTPDSILLIITNFIVVCVAATLFADKHHISTFFWVIMGFLAVYNVYKINRDKELYTKITVIAYIISIVVLIAMVILFQVKS